MEGGGAGVTYWAEQSGESMRRCFTIYSIFLDIKNRFWYQEIYPISWYQSFIFGFKDIKNRFLISRNWIEFFLYQDIGLIFFISSIFFFISRNSFFLNIKNRFLISRNTEWIVKWHFSAPFYYLFDFFFNSWYKKNSNLSFWYKISARFFNHEFNFFS